jgi:uncharacterized Fe-S cluster protein YjdI
VKSLPEAFDIATRPWVNMDGAPVADIVKAVAACPSGALSYTLAGNDG